MKRPLAVSALCMAGGIIIYDGIIYKIWGLILILLLSAALLLVCRRFNSSSRFLFLCLPFLMLGFLLHGFYKDYYYNRFTDWDGQEVTLTGILSNEPVFDGEKTVFILDVQSLTNGEDLERRGLVRISIYEKKPLSAVHYGVGVRLSGKLKLPSGQRNLGGFDYRRFLAGRGISAVMSVKLENLVLTGEERGFFLKKAGYSIRASVTQSLHSTMDEEQAVIAAAMLIGYTDDLPEELEESFRVAGLSHVMAVSGANLAFLLLPLLALFQLMGLSPRGAAFLSAPFLVFYVFATGMEASVVRAAVMAGVMLSGTLIWRKTDIYCSLGVSAVIMLSSNTFMLYDMGFLLSFGATLSLTLFYKPLYHRIPAFLPKFLKDTLAGTLAAQIGVLPIIAVGFNTFSAVSLLSNLLVVPATGLLTLMYSLIALLYPPLPWAGSLVGVPAGLLTKLMIGLTEKIASIPWAEVKMATPGFHWLFWYYALALFLTFGFKGLKKDRARGVLACFILAAGLFITLPRIIPQPLKLYFTDVGQGDSALILTPKGKSILMDGGGSDWNKTDHYVGERVVLPLLYDMGVSSLDIMVASHGHSDHISGLESVLTYMPVKKLVVSDGEDPGLEELIALAESKGVPVVRLGEGELIYQEKDLSFRVLYPLKDKERMPTYKSKGSNEQSLVARLDYGSFSALFTGDMGFPSEKLLLENEELKAALEECDLLKVAHHGSKYSSDPDFLRVLNPSAAVISAGENRYGHPNPQVVSGLVELGAKVYTTLDRGGVLIESAMDKGEEMIKIHTVIP